MCGMTARVDEIAPDVHRICVYVPEFQLQFNHFLIRDDEPLLFHAGLRGMFPMVREAVARVLDPSKLRWIAFSHFESDEGGALNKWLELAPSAQVACQRPFLVLENGGFAAAHDIGAGDRLPVAGGLPPLYADDCWNPKEAGGPETEDAGRHARLEFHRELRAGPAGPYPGPLVSVRRIARFGRAQATVRISRLPVIHSSV